MEDINSHRVEPNPELSCVNFEESCSCFPLKTKEVISPLLLFTATRQDHFQAISGVYHVLVVTSPAPESTNRLDPEVVTPNAAKAAGMHASKKSENLIVKEECVDSGLCRRQADFYMRRGVPKIRDIASGFSSDLTTGRISFAGAAMTLVKRTCPGRHSQPRNR